MAKHMNEWPLNFSEKARLSEKSREFWTIAANRLKFNLKQVCCCVGERGKVRAELGWDQNLCFMNLLLPGLYCRKFIRRHFLDISVLDNV